MAYADVYAMVAEISKICRYPVKGLSPENLFEGTLESGGALTNDRRFALALGSTRFDTAIPHWLPKSSFLALVKNEKLAALETVFDDGTDTLQVLRGGKQVARGKLTDLVGRAIMEDFFSAYMKDEARGKPHLVEAKGDAIFTDQKRKLISIINLASVRDFERVVGKPVDPIRFRANVYIDGIDPWSEFGWVGKEISCGGATLEVMERICRCAAINVDPQTGERDINLVNFLQGGFGHNNMGVLAKVTKAGYFAIGDALGR
jgi:uncharacterized protein YcbX